MKTSMKTLKSLNTQIQGVCCALSNSNDTFKTATPFLAILAYSNQGLLEYIRNKKVEVVQKKKIPSLQSLFQVWRLWSTTEVQVI